MCGIVAGIGKKIEKKYIRLGLLATQSRGTDATGVFQPGVGIIKNGEEASKFVKSDLFDSVAESCNMFIGHCRQGTHGSEKDNNNNHPMEGEKFILVHNGIVQMKDREDYTYKGECDSERILSYLEMEKDPEKAFGSIHGQASLVFTDKKDGNSFMVWRNTAPLVTAFNKKKQQLFVASTEVILKSVLSQVELDGLIASMDGWVISEIPANFLWKVWYKNGKVDAKLIGRFESGTIMNTRKSYTTQYAGWNGNLRNNPYGFDTKVIKGRIYRWICGQWVEQNQTTPSTVKSKIKQPCPLTGFSNTDSGCRSCCEFDSCKEDSEKDEEKYIDKNLEDVLKDKSCTSYSRGDPLCRTCILRTLCNNGELELWDAEILPQAELSHLSGEEIPQLEAP